MVARKRDLAALAASARRRAVSISKSATESSAIWALAPCHHRDHSTARKAAASPKITAPYLSTSTGTARRAMKGTTSAETTVAILRHFPAHREAGSRADRARPDLPRTGGMPVSPSNHMDGKLSWRGLEKRY